MLFFESMSNETGKKLFEALGIRYAIIYSSFECCMSEFQPENPSVAGTLIPKSCVEPLRDALSADAEKTDEQTF
jgi:hypothetical protein